MKRYILPVYILLICLFLFPSICVQGAKNGLLLWFNTIIPSIFPFILITGLLRTFGGIDIMEKYFGPLISKIFKCQKHSAYAVIIGFLCGYPLGAKAVADIYSLGYIDRNEADYLLTFCNNPSPMFVMNYIVIASLGRPELIPVFMAAIYIAAWQTACISYAFVYKKRTQKLYTRHIFALDYSPGILMDNCILDALATIQKIGVYMILFSILSQLIAQLPDQIYFIKLMLVGLCEQTTGIDTLMHANIFLPEYIKTVLAAIFTSFGGFAVAAQTQGIIGSYGLSIKPYFIGKILHAALTAVMLAILIHII